MRCSVFAYERAEKDPFCRSLFQNCLSEPGHIGFLSRSIISGLFSCQKRLLSFQISCTQENKRLLTQFHDLTSLFCCISCPDTPKPLCFRFTWLLCSMHTAGSSEERLLERALAMSMETDPAPPTTTASLPDFSAMTEDEQIAYAMQMSLQQARECTFVCLLGKMVYLQACWMLYSACCLPKEARLKYNRSLHTGGSAI